MTQLTDSITAPTAIDLGHTPVHEGTLKFHHPSLPADKECYTWYKIVGDLSSSAVPLVVLHGGPGACHNYLLNLSLLASRHGIPVIFYDQLGNGLSTHLREKRLDTAFWTPDLLLAELENLLGHLRLGEHGGREYDLLGQSWGGMMGSMWASRQPAGLRRMVISNSPASMELWVSSCRKWQQLLPEDVRKAIEKGEEEEDYDSKEYKAAVMFFYKRHMCRVWPPPPDAQASLEWLEKDDTVYMTMNGPSEFTVVGNLKNWDIRPSLHKINVPTLVLNAEFDEARDPCVAPFFEGLKKCKWYTFPGLSHMSNVEDIEAYLNIVHPFLAATKEGREP